MLRRCLLLIAFGAAPALAQDTPATPRAPMRSNVEYARGAWQEVQGNLLQAAKDAPDSVFAFRPAADVRSFGETLDHVAASQHGYCLMALGERPAGGGAGTGASTRAAVMAALEASNAVCERAYGQSEEDAALPAFGSGRASRLHVLLTNALHDGEHYGNVVTYLRLHGIVPPSSRPAPR